MARMTFVVLLVLAAVCACMAGMPKPPPKEDCCGKNEVWTKCGSPCQEARCDDSNKHIMCPAVCMERCQCIKGTMRNEKGECVEPCDC